MAETAQDAWYFSRDGQQSGPLRFSEIQEKANQGLLRPRTDLIWREGMPDWRPIGEIEGLFERKPVPVEPVAFDPYIPPVETAADTLASQGGWPGYRRRAYLAVIFGLPCLFFVAAFILAFLSHPVPSSQQAPNPILGGPVLVAVQLAMTILSIWAGLQRLVNLGMSRWWYFGMLVPILNLWVAYRCWACPAGYAYHKKMDGAGIFLAIVYWLFLILIIVAFVGLGLALEQGSPELKHSLREILQHSSTRR
ncbi:DUF4339 domain-containing protein [Luteolibacter pohnpeiensis]|uniref:DUF4339 domain-containing protein n=1 Tax=Luteolibacter pohnpeiensis TaxID=454153 RepID=A0A934VQW4_9BACT|nr:GYF domain-containing protein [Luteolibacter pohnpeiensis]MBK1882531.1 DUF4339 domain-containing protein [Luteolibacter pohnpeiensis]